MQISIECEEVTVFKSLFQYRERGAILKDKSVQPVVCVDTDGLVVGDFETATYPVRAVRMVTNRQI